MSQPLHAPDADCLLRALHLQPVERTPFWDVIYGIPPELAEALLGRPLDRGSDLRGQLSDYSPVDQLALARLLGIDVIGFRTGWSWGGEVWETGSDGERRYVDGRIKSRHDLQSLPPLDIDSPCRKVERFLATVEGTGAGVWIGLSGVFHDVIQSVGYQDFMYALYDDLAFVETLLDIGVERNQQLLAALSQYPLAFVRIYEDVAHNQGLLIEPSRFRALWRPRIEALLAPARQAGIPITLHCCGSLRDLLPLAIESGFAGIDPFQPECNDIYALHAQYGHRICFLGNMGLDVLIKGPAERIARLAREQIARLGRTGYVVRPNALSKDVPPAHLLALAGAVRSFRWEPGSPTQQGMAGTVHESVDSRSSNNVEYT